MAEPEAERDPVRAGSVRRVLAYVTQSNARPGYRPMTVTLYLSQPSCKTESDYRQAHQEYDEQLVARLSTVTKDR